MAAEMLGVEALTELLALKLLVLDSRLIANQLTESAKRCPKVRPLQPLLFVHNSHI